MECFQKTFLGSHFFIDDTISLYVTDASSLGVALPSHQRVLSIPFAFDVLINESAVVANFSVKWFRYLLDRARIFIQKLVFFIFIMPLLADTKIVFMGIKSYPFGV